MTITLDDITIYYEADSLFPPASLLAKLMRWQTDPAEAVEVLRFLADGIEKGSITAGRGYRVTLELYGDDTNPNFVGK